MRIYIMRHGQAEVIAGKDSLRPLTDAGMYESSQVAHWLKSQLPAPLDWILVSPYKRALQTLSAFNAVFPCKNHQQLDELVPEGNAQAVCDYLVALINDEKLDSLLLISHLPLVSFIVEILSPANIAPIFHTAEIACIEYEPDTVIGELIWMQPPHSLP